MRLYWHGWGMCSEMKFYYETLLKGEWRAKHIVELATYAEWRCILSKVSWSEKSSRRPREMESFRENAINLLQSIILCDDDCSVMACAVCRRGLFSRGTRGDQCCLLLRWTHSCGNIPSHLNKLMHSWASAFSRLSASRRL